MLCTCPAIEFLRKIGQSSSRDGRNFGNFGQRFKIANQKGARLCSFWVRVGRVELHPPMINEWLNHADCGSVESKHQVADVICNSRVSSVFIPSWATGGQRRLERG